MATKAVLPGGRYQSSSVETVNAFGERKFSLQRRRHHRWIVGVDRQRDAQSDKSPKVGLEADPRVARWAYAEAYAAIDQQPKHLGIGLGPHAVSDASRAQHLHGLTNHIGTSNLPRMRHEPKPGFARTLNHADEGRC